MQKYNNQKELVAIVCNQCGKELNVKHGYCTEGVVSIHNTFGYFTQKDGCCHALDLCEACYDELVKNLKIPVTISEKWDFD